MDNIIMTYSKTNKLSAPNLQVLSITGDKNYSSTSIITNTNHHINGIYNDLSFQNAQQLTEYVISNTMANSVTQLLLQIILGFLMELVVFTVLMNIMCHLHMVIINMLLKMLQ